MPRRKTMYDQYGRVVNNIKWGIAGPHPTFPGVIQVVSGTRVRYLFKNHPSGQGDIPSTDGPFLNTDYGTAEPFFSTVFSTENVMMLHYWFTGEKEHDAKEEYLQR